MILSKLRWLRILAHIFFFEATLLFYEKPGHYAITQSISVQFIMLSGENMPRNIRIIGFTGMKRQDSYNKAALYSARELLPEHAELEIVSVDDLPTFEQTALMPESVARFRETLQQADAVLIASPEYKGLLPAGLKNALAWALYAGNTSVLSGKPTALMGIGRQSATEQQRLRQLLAEKQVSVLVDPALYVSAHEKFNRDGKLAHEETEQQLRELLATLVVHARDARSALVG